jgi:hypothetical protein
MATHLHTVNDDSVDHRVAKWKLWLALLGTPSLWLAHFLLAYTLVEASCGEAVPTAPAGSLHTVLLVGTVLFTLVCGGLTVFAWRIRRRVIRSERAFDDVFGKVGFIMGLLFTFALLLEGLPLFFLNPCA